MHEVPLPKTLLTAVVRACVSRESPGRRSRSEQVRLAGPRLHVTELDACSPALTCRPSLQVANRQPRIFIHREVPPNFPIIIDCRGAHGPGCRCWLENKSNQKIMFRAFLKEAFLPHPKTDIPNLLSYEDANPSPGPTFACLEAHTVLYIKLDIR